MNYDYGMAGPDDLPEFMRCPDDCVANAMRRVSATTVRKITKEVPGGEPETYVNVEDVRALAEGIMKLQVTVMEHTPGASLAAAEPIVLGMAGLATNLLSILSSNSKQMVENSVPETIPAEWK